MHRETHCHVMLDQISDIAPVRPTQDNLKFELPSSDCRTTNGYVTPGVIVMR